MTHRRTAQDYALDDRLVARWRSKTDTAGEGCWPWQGSTFKSSGYGQIHVRLRAGKWSSTVAHRVAYEIYRGPIPDGSVLDHLCRNRSCVNPAHLEAVDDRTNILRGTGFAARHARKTHCPASHPYSPENTYLDSRGLRHCRACFRDRYLAKKKRQEANR
jgi:hypothetical protein